MKAAYIEKTGPVKNIIYGDLPQPELAENQVLVKVGAVSVNPVDTYIRSGMYEMELPEPFIVGCDLAGVVEEVGENCQRFKPGDRVWGSNQGLFGRQGTFAEYAAVDECWLYNTPAEVSDEQAAATAMVGITAHLGLFRHVRLKMGETLFVHGGTGGVGSCVVQMAKTIGARVMASGRNIAKIKACRKLGAAATVDYEADDFADIVREFAPEGIDVWWETAREQDLDQAIELISPGGRVVLMAGRDSRPQLPVGALYSKDCKILGFAMFNASPDQQRKSAAEINRWMARRGFQANIDRVMPLEETAAAHKLQERNTLQRADTLAGKIVLKP